MVKKRGEPSHEENVIPKHIPSNKKSRIEFMLEHNIDVENTQISRNLLNLEVKKRNLD